MTSTPAKAVSNETLVDLMISERYNKGIHALKEEKINTALDMIREDDPSILALAYELLTSGSTRARIMVADHLYGSAMGIIEAIQKVQQSPNEYGNGWKAECAWGDELKSVLISGWETGSVIDESGVALADEEEEFGLVDYIKTAHGELYGDDHLLHKRQDRIYWRGLAVLALAHRFVTGGRGATEVKPSEFIEWAGSHPDIKSIIDQVRERNTLNPEHLQAVMDEKGQTTAPLRDGTL